MIWALPLLPAVAGALLWAWGDGSRGRIGGVAAAVMAATLALVFAADAPGAAAWAPAFTLRAEMTPFARAVAATTAAVTLAVVVFAAAHEATRGLARLVGLLLMFAGAMELVVIAADFVTLLIGWELMGAASWALIGHRWREGRPMRSANYAFVATRAGDLGLFIALFACFAGTGSVEYAALERLGEPALAVVALGVVTAAAAKAGQVPFAPWLFRAMDGPTSVSALLHASTMVAAGAFLLARLHPQLSAAPAFGAAALTAGLVTAIAGGVVALRQMHAKRLLAGSTSAQIGLMFAATGAGYPGLAVLHLVAHAAVKAALFFSAGIAHGAAESFDLRRMRLGRAAPWSAAFALIAAAGLAGVPPTGAAWSKEKIVAGLGHASPWLAFAAIAAGGLSAAYATRFWVMAWGPGEGEKSRPARGAAAALGALALAALVTSALWLPAWRAPVLEGLGAGAPSSPPFEVWLSLGLVALGLLAGLRLAQRPGEDERAQWLGLAPLIGAAVIRPALRFSEGLARVDDDVVDGMGPASVPALRVSKGLSRLDDEVVDGAASGRGAVAALVRLGLGTARLGARTGEAAADLIASGSAVLAVTTGADVRRTQSGMAHHYYLMLVAGAVAGVAILMLGGA